jgi:uncharacterized protein (DUF488 family)
MSQGTNDGRRELEGPQFDLFSIGHSTHPIWEFLSLLDKHPVDAVADVRSSPWSRYNPQFNRENLEHELTAAGIAYVFLGDTLGGRPRAESLYDAQGHALYGEMAKTDDFQEGLGRLLRGAARYKISMMCSEEDPANCHRFLLITRVLHGLGKTVGHVRADGSLVTTEDIETFQDWDDPDYVELSLFGQAARSSWRSTQPVLQRSRRSSSSQS